MSATAAQPFDPDATARGTILSAGRATKTVHFAPPAPTAPPVAAAEEQAAMVGIAAPASERSQRTPVWPGLLLPPIEHPAFPGMLVAALVVFAVAACRGDRRDPKLNRSAVDGRDDRTPFR